jgi:sugar phosphate isomerase/epimerase
MIRAAVTVSLVPEAKGGPFVFWDDLASACAEAAALNFHGVEIFAPGPDAVDRVALKDLLARFGLSVAAMGTGGGWLRHGWHLAHPDAEVRRQARVFIRAMMRLAAEFGAPAILGSMAGRAVAPVTREQALTWLTEAVADLGAEAARLGVRLLVEPLNRYETNLLNRVEDVLELARQAAAPGVRVLADLFHLNIEERSITAALRAAGDRLGHVHFVDSNRQAAGFGHLEFEPVVQALRSIRYDGYVSAEVLPLPTPAEAAKQTMASFRALFRTPEFK